MELSNANFDSCLVFLQHSYTALHIAACKGHLEIVKMLVERYNCLVDAFARDEVTPLLLAAASGHEDVVEYLLDHEAAIDSTRVSQPLYNSSL